jgi:hypothetical protein
VTTSPFDGQNCLPTLSLILPETPLPQRGRQILDARLGYPAHCICCRLRDRQHLGGWDKQRGFFVVMWVLPLAPCPFRFWISPRRRVWPKPT